MKKRTKAFAVLFLDVLLCGMLFAVPSIAQWMSERVPACIFLKNGILCPSCGATRCIRDMSLGAFSSAFRYNPFVFSLVLYIGGVVLLMNLSVLFHLRFARNTVAFAVHYKTLVTLMGCFAVFGLLRNFV
ncbi:MAG: DUF2752 domain-containing protein [Ruminococcaceae bacterium]|nr:DUF2752 domain-containing protein [Oscillospiraceae bacterium]